MDIKDVHDIYHKNMYLENNHLIDTEYATFLTKELDEEPLWIIPIGSSSYGKSTIAYPLIRMSEDERFNILLLDTLTSKSFSTGNIGERLEGKRSLILIPDLSGISEMPIEEQGALWAQFRTVHDGFIKRDIGKTAGLHSVDYRNIKTNLLAFGTPEVEQCICQGNKLGTRDIMYRLPKYEFIDRCLDDNKELTYAKKEEIYSVVYKFLVEKMNNKVFSSPNQFYRNELKSIANRIAIWRVEGNFSDKNMLTSMVVPELPIRIYRQLNTLWKGLDWIGLTNDENLKTIRSIEVTLGNETRIRVYNKLRFIEENGYVEKTRRELSNELNIDPDEILKQLMVLRDVGFVEPCKTGITPEQEQDDKVPNYYAIGSFWRGVDRYGEREEIGREEI